MFNSQILINSLASFETQLVLWRRFLLTRLYCRQMESGGGGGGGGETPAFSPDRGAAPGRKLPACTVSLLECPVCLEIAWPPKRIFQVTNQRPTICN